jgi:hypothetical protein
MDAMSGWICPHCGATGLGSEFGVVHADNCPVKGQPTKEVRDVIQSLTGWWMENAKREAEKLGPKAIEYGSYDLELIGDVLHTIIDHSSNRARAKDLESGIIFYLIGKIARLASALRDGHEPSDDTFLDISIYARMALYIREKGQWP